MFDVNANQVAPQEVLSNNVYYYNRERDHMEILKSIEVLFFCPFLTNQRRNRYVR